MSSRAGSPNQAHLLLRALERRASVGPCPERSLVLAVLTQAAIDMRGRSYAAPAHPAAHRFVNRERAYSEDARAFLDDGRCAFWCDLIGIPAAYGRECIRTWATHTFEVAP